MCLDKFTVLQEMYDTFLQDRKEINEKIQKNNEKIEEIDAFIQSVNNEAESDFRVFSPRSAKTVYKDKIIENKQQKQEYENENQNHYRRLSQTNKQIEKIELLLHELKHMPKNDDIVNNVTAEKGNDTYSFKALELQEEERQRIARELHDSTVQNLTHLVHTIELSALYIDQDPIRAKLELETSIKDLKQTIQDIRDTIFDLRPMTFDDLGFKKCLEELISSICKEFPECEISHDICDITLEASKNARIFNLTIYRIIQEALLNSLKHSQANKINVIVCRNEAVCHIEISDNGKGFCLSESGGQYCKHFGLSIMKERVDLLGGKITINTELEKGTEIEIDISIS